MSFGADALTDGDGHYELHWDISLELSLRTVEHLLSERSMEQRKHYWAGVTFAIQKTEEILKLAFDAPAVNDEAA